MSYAGYLTRRYSENDPIENTNIDMINIDNAYKSNDVTYGFTVILCHGLLLLVTIFAMYLQYQRLVLGMIFGLIYCSSSHIRIICECIQP